MRNIERSKSPAERLAGIAAAAVLFAGFLSSAATAATVDGTIITNQALVTFHSLSNARLTTSYLVTAAVQVIDPRILSRKEAIPPMQVAGGTVKFCIWLVNTSQYGSAWSVIVQDKLDGNAFSGGFSYLSGGIETWSGTAGSTVRYGYRGPGMFDVPVWDLEAPDGSLGYYIRFLVNPIGPGQSAMVCFKAKVL